MFEGKTIGAVEHQFETNIEQGLDHQVANRRKAKDGANVLTDGEQKTKAEMFLEQLNEPLIYVLFIASGLSMLLGEISDTCIILFVILMNAVVGVIQEGKAVKAMEALKKLTSPTAIVIRNGKKREIKAEDLVVGDIVYLEAGGQVPADIRLTESANLKVDESALTGESTPVEKDANFVASKPLPLGDRKNMVFMTTNVLYGRGEGIVVATGMNSEIGTIATMIHEAKTELTPLQKRLADLGKLLSILAVLLCVALFGIALIQKRPLLEMLLTAISLAVAAVPEGLPAIVTIVLALSVSRMVKINTIIRKLPSVETLGSVGVVCSDKTGTLTKNKMTVVSCYTDGKLIPVENLRYERNKQFVHGFTLCNDATIMEKEELGDPTEIALLAMAKNCGVNKEELEKKIPRIDEIPFDSTRKMMTTLHKEAHKTISYTKGGCDTILNKCVSVLKNGTIVPMTKEIKEDIQKAMNEMTNNALRVLALAMKEQVTKAEEHQLIFLGLVGMIDPEREEAVEAIQIFQQAGVKTVMITGDHVDTAFAIAKKLHIATSKEECITGEQMNQMSDDTLQANINTYSVFARVSPEHKQRIIKAHKISGKVVAMTGDGVNDAPALKSADIGIAMGKNGTDVAKQASDMILTDDNFATIEKAIEEGRSIYENIKKSVLFLLSSNFGEIITMFFAVLVGLASPLKASHILWVNLITDSLPALALGVDENDKKRLMKKKPRNPKESLFAHGGLTCTIFYGCLIGGLSLLAFLTIPMTKCMAEGGELTLSYLSQVLSQEDILVRSQTYAFTVLGISQLFHAIGMRNTEVSIFKNNIFLNPMMIFAFIFGLLLQVVVTEIPYLTEVFGTAQLTIKEWIQLMFLSSIPLLTHEVFCLCKGEQSEKEETY